MTLTEFLLARIAEDEADARQVLSEYAEHQPVWDCPATGVLNVGDPGIEGLHGLGDGPLAYHIARHDPARVLAECSAKRRIVELHAPVGDGTGFEREPARGDGTDGCPVCDWDPDCESLNPYRLQPYRGCATLRLLALPYATHPDYDEEWRP